MSNKEEFETGMHQDKTETSDEISVTEGTAEESENYDEEISDFEDDESGHDDEIEYIEEDMVYPDEEDAESDMEYEDEDDGTSESEDYDEGIPESDDEYPETGMMEKKRRRRRRGARRKEKKNYGKKPWIIAGSIVAGLLVIYLGISAFFISHFYVNTTINGKDFSGKTAADVEEYLRQQVDGYELTILELDNATDVIRGSDIHLEYKENSDVEDALKAQNPLLWVKAFFSRTSTDVTINVEYDQTALDEKIQSLQAVVREQTEPVSAYPKFDGNSFVVEPEVYGTAVNMETLTSKIEEYITEFKSELDMEAEECYKMPQYTSESPEVQAACDTMNQYCQASVTYTMTENVVVDKTVISTWLSYDENMQVTFNEDAVREWMREFGSTYDTVGTTRSITTPGGKTVEVSGGTYGWSIDEETETQNLINSIKNGEVVTREPAYAQTAASHSAQDWGTTYIEVDLSAQHMWYIVDGSVALETDVVTGLPTADRQTPAGVYYILYTERNATLKGETNPETGKPIYETPVSYWMPFTWQGHGFHDANWQSSFGGSRYQTNGSHGCVNMPVDQAGNLFSMISAGTPVVIHY